VHHTLSYELMEATETLIPLLKLGSWGWMEWERVYESDVKQQVWIRIEWFGRISVKASAMRAGLFGMKESRELGELFVDGAEKREIKEPV